MTDQPRSAGDELVELLPKLKGRQLWVLDMTPTERWPAPGSAPTEEMMQLFVDHIRWLEQHESTGALFLSGTINQQDGIGPGMAVLNVATRDDAEALAGTEPFGLAGLRTNTIRAWTVNEGSMTFTIKLFANSTTIEPRH
jgi:uncharacterized protein YciI